MPTAFHSVRLEEDKCVGCTTCIKKCPTEAIRVRKGRASIIDERCIDCGECIRTCPHGAKKAVSDPLSMISGFRFKVAVPAPSLYSQFAESTSVDRILSGLLALGFDEVFEVAEAAELVTEFTKRLLAEKADRARGGTSPQSRIAPLISSACPAVVRLVQLRFPSLIPQLVPLRATDGGRRPHRQGADPSRRGGRRRFLHHALRGKGDSDAFAIGLRALRPRRGHRDQGHLHSPSERPRLRAGAAAFSRRRQRASAGAGSTARARPSASVARSPWMESAT